MTDLRKAAEQALEALEEIGEEWGFTPERTVPNRTKAIKALRQALAQPEQEWDSRHPKAQALIGERARLRIELGLVERLVDDPHFETTPSDMEYWGPLHDKLEEALTQPKQEPVAWWDPKLGVFDEKHFDQLQPLFTAPPKREWVGLADEEIYDYADKFLYQHGSNYGIRSFGKAIESKLKEKNGG